MKKRLGFVSNSSSSSFVLCGIEVENLCLEDDGLYDACEEVGLKMLEGAEDGVEGLVIGKLLATGEDYDFDSNKIPLTELADTMNGVNDLVLSKKVKLVGEPSIFTGTMMT